jgi:hypothetical protein
MEPGGDELEECVRLWLRLGKSELVDIAAHHEEHSKDWFSERSRSQPTWMKLIWLLLAYKGIEPTRDATLAYQRAHLGRANDETVLLEISALPAKHNGVPVARELYREERALLIRERMLQHQPSFVVFYTPGPSYAPTWNLIAGRTLVREEPVDVDGTTCLMTYHTNYKRDRAYWIGMGQKLRAFNDSRGLKG